MLVEIYKRSSLSRKKNTQREIPNHLDLCQQ